ncbi:MAG: ABC transporter permease [Desulfotalea sp.]
MSCLQRIITLIIKEFGMVLRDPKSRVVVIVPPILQFFVFSFAATFDLTDVQYAVLDHSRTIESRQLLAGFEGSDNFKLVATLSSENQIRDMIDTSEARLVISIPADFSEKLANGEQTVIQVIADGRNSNVASIALGYVNTIVQQQGSRILLERGEVPNEPSLELINRAWFNENLVSRWYIVSALGGIISMIVVMILSSLSVAREREFGTFDQLLVAPFRPFEILIGKAIPPIVFGLVDALILSVVAVYLFGIPFHGTIPALIITLTIFMIAVVGVGLFISSISTTMQQALLGSFVFIMPAVILGGFTTPIENMPNWLQIATYIDPLRYVVYGLRQIFLAGGDTAAVWPQLWPMACIALITLPLASWMFRRRTT